MKALFMSGRLTEAEAELELQFRTVMCPTAVSHAEARVWKEQR